MKFFKRSKRSEKEDLLNSQNNKIALISNKLDTNISIIKEIFSLNSDFIFREISLGNSNRKGFIIFFDGLVKTSELNEHLIESIKNIDTEILKGNDIKVIADTITIANTKIVKSFEEVINNVLTGETAFFIDQIPFAYIVSEKEWEKRNISEPITESTVRGSREGFTESIRSNTSLIRRRIKTPNLKMESFKIGKLTKTDVVISYIEGIVNPDIVAEVRNRLNRINVDSILDSNYIEELIEDSPFSIFPTIQNTERPDKVAANLLEGRVAIIVDGCPNVLMVPTIMLHFLHSSDDYYERFYFTFAIRLIRILAFFTALFLPSLYIAVTTFHQEMIPTKLLMSIIGARDPVPFPSFIEALIMELTFEILREAGLRLPKMVGGAVSIVGALVIGESAVQAGLVSSAMIIVVSLTAIASFSIPAFNLAISLRMLRFIIMIFAAFTGLYGIIISMLILIIYTNSLRSFGVPYLAPYAPLLSSDWKDFIIRFPWWQMEKRPQSLQSVNKIRQRVQRPKPPN